MAEAIEFCRRMEERGLDGLGAEAVAAGLGYGNIKTNTFSAPLSAARQFGLLDLRDEGYHLTTISRGLIHPLDEASVTRLHRQALGLPPLYSELITRFSERKVPDAPALANLLYHQFHITSAAKQAAAESFLESARFAGVLGPDNVLRLEPIAPPAGPEPVSDVESRPNLAPAPQVVIRDRPPVPIVRASTSPASEVRIDLRLWGPDSGKLIRVRAPESITEESYERLLQALKLHMRIQSLD